MLTTLRAGLGGLLLCLSFSPLVAGEEVRFGGAVLSDVAFDYQPSDPLCGPAPDGRGTTCSLDLLFEIDPSLVPAGGAILPLRCTLALQTSRGLIGVPVITVDTYPYFAEGDGGTTRRTVRFQNGDFPRVGDRWESAYCTSITSNP